MSLLFTSATESRLWAICAEAALRSGRPAFEAVYAADKIILEYQQRCPAPDPSEGRTTALERYTEALSKPDTQ